MADEQVVDSGTATAAEAGEQTQDTTKQTPAEKPATTDTATPADDGGVLSKEDLEKAANAGKGEAPEEEADDPVKKLDPKSQERINKKIGRLTGNAKALEAENARLREEAAFLKGQTEALKAQGMTQKEADAAVAKATVDMPKRPRMKDFEDQESYEAALDKYESVDFPKWVREDLRREQTATEAKKKGETEAQAAEIGRQEALQRVEKRKTEVLQGVAQKFGNEAADEVLRKAARGEFVLTQAMRDAVFDGDAPPETLKFLSDHPDISEKIGNIQSPARQVLEIGRLTSAITGKAIRVSTTPEPLSKVSGGGGVKPDESKMSDAEWYKHRQQQNISSA